MRVDISLKTPRLILRLLSLEDATDSYLAWMRNCEVIRYLESRFSAPTSKKDLKKFIQSTNESPNYLLFGIFLQENEKHIGNIKLGPIVTEHARAEIGYLIGERKYWGKGYASEAIIEICRFGFIELGLHKITAGVYENNVASEKTLIKSGFLHEATISSHVIFEGQRIGSKLFGIKAPDSFS
jgi:RimJ/RimL family protein N-acetyltransferase